MNEVTEAEFNELVWLEKPVVFDFYADWCQPCKMIKPYLQEIASDYQGLASFYMVDAEAEYRLADRLGIKSVPTVLMFRDGVLLKSLVGAQNPMRYREMIQDALSV